MPSNRNSYVQAVQAVGSAGAKGASLPGSQPGARLGKGDAAHHQLRLPAQPCLGLSGAALGAALPRAASTFTQLQPLRRAALQGVAHLKIAAGALLLTIHPEVGRPSELWLRVLDLLEGQCIKVGGGRRG